MNYDTLLSHPIYKAAKNIILACNQTAYDFNKKIYLFDLIKRDQKLTTLFTLEHGLFSNAQDQVEVSNETFQGIPCFSLYQKDKKHDTVPSNLYTDVDAVVIDIENVGTRYYTFIAHLFRVIRATPSDIPILLINRQNLIGDRIEGTILPTHFASILGVAGLMHRHGMNTRQLCQWYINTHKRQRAWPSIIPIEMTLDEDRALIAPSPNLPTRYSLDCYPGQCLWEATTWSEGRGTTQPFEIVGHPSLPWSKSEIIAEKFNNRFDSKALIRNTTFTPTFHKHSGQSCIGWQLIIMNPSQYPAVFGTLFLMRLCLQYAPEITFWRTGPYEYDTDLTAAEALIGDNDLIQYVEGLVSEEFILDKMAVDQKRWAEVWN